MQQKTTSCRLKNRLLRLLHFFAMEWRVNNGAAELFNVRQKNRQSFIDLYHFLVIMQKAVTAVPKNHFSYHYGYITTSI